MRNKHSQKQPDENGFINIIDEQQLHSYNPPSPLSSGNPNAKNNQFAMIIEENSPNNASSSNLIFSKVAKGTGNQTLESSRRVSVMEDKATIDFTRV